MIQTAVVGSGVAALMAVRTLCLSSIENDHLPPIQVTWFTARRKMGATQSALSKSPVAKPKAGDAFFDYGCQYMSPVNPDFRDELERWKGLGLVSDGFEVSVVDAATRGGMTKLETAGWVGNGGMGPMLEALTLQTVHEFEGLKHVSGFPEVSQQVVSLHREERTRKWFLNTERKPCEFGPFDYVIGGFGHPKRTDPFLKSGGNAAKPMMNFLKGGKYNQFFVLQLVLEKGQREEVLRNLSACHVRNHGVLSFVADNSKKPHQGRVPARSARAPHITLISTAEYARQNKKKNRQLIQDEMLGSFAGLILKRSLPEARATFRPRIHRLNYWGDGRCLNVLDGTDGFLFDKSVNLGWCGEFCVAPSVDGAAQSGVAVAKFCIDRCELSRGNKHGSKAATSPKWKWIESDATVVDIGRFSHLGKE